MDKDVHWLIRSLNSHLHGLDAQNDEVLMWRKRYLKVNQVPPPLWNYFLSNPSIYFKDKTPEQLLQEAKEYNER